MKNDTKIKLISFGILLFLIALLIVLMLIQDHIDRINDPVKPKVTLLLAPDPVNGTDIIITEMGGAMHIVTRKRVPPIGETEIRELGWIKK